MMKKLLLIVSLFVTVLFAVGQSMVSSPSSPSSVEKIFREALKSPRRPGNPYRVDNKNKSLTREKLEALAEKSDIQIVDVETSRVTRFGDVSTMINCFYFLPNQEVIQYMMEKVMGDRGVPDMNSSSNLALLYFYNKDSGKFTKIEAHWSGSVSGGYASGQGIGVAYFSDTFYAVEGSFANGFLVGDVTFTKESDKKVSTNVHADSFKKGMALCKLDGKLGYVDQSSFDSRPTVLEFAIKPTYTEDVFVAEYGKLGDYFVVLDDKKEEIKINKRGEKIGYSDNQIAINEQKRLEEERRLLAEKREKEEKERAAAEEAERRRIEEERIAAARNAKIKQNSNIKLWEIGSRLCHVYPYNEKKVIMVTLEEWNASKSKAKVRVVASPSSTATLNGELLQKNNTFWIDTKNEGWYLAWPEEVELALYHDDSQKRETVVYQNSSSSSSSSSPSICSKCGGRGRQVCSWCNGTGWFTDSWGSDDGPCTYCNGSGYYRCYDCNGKGTQ